MTLRLVLVSLVAALGITIPNRTEFESWVATTQNWMNARFAEWDSRHPLESDYVIINEISDAEFASMRPSKPAGIALNATPSHPGTSTKTERSPLNQTTANHITPVAATPAPKTASSPTFEPIEVGENLYPGIAYQLNRDNEGLGIIPPVVIHPRTTPRKFEPMEIREAVDFALELNRWNDGIGVVPLQVTRTRLVTIHPRNRFEPMEIGEDLYTGVAFELNRRNDGIGLVPPASATRPEPDFQQEADALSLGFVYEVKHTSKTAVPVSHHVEAAKPVVAEPSFEAMEKSKNLYFADSLEPVGDVANVTPHKVSQPVKSSPRLDGIEKAGEIKLGFAGQVYTMRLDGREESSRIEVSAAARPRFEPMEVGEDLYVGIAYELNRRNEGLGLTSTATLAGERTLSHAAVRGPDLNRAVRLTRDAVYAWVNVFTGPALVTVAQ